MACCGADAVLKTTAQGTQFFAHKSKSSSCSVSDGESRDHQFAKYVVCRTLHELGWNVQTEKRGSTPDGRIWVADVYAEKGKTKVAVEIQWSPQSFVDTQLRQQAYQQSGVRGLWLIRDPKGKTNALTGDYAYRTRELPVFTLAKENNAMHVYDIWVVDKNTLKGSPYHRASFTLVDFIQAMFTKKFDFELRGPDRPEMSIEVMPQMCWKCKEDINTVGRVNYYEQAYGQWVRVPDRGLTIRQIPEVDVEIINQHFVPMWNMAPLRRRYSKTTQSMYMANSCPHCDALMGSFFEDSCYNDYDHAETETVPAAHQHNYGRTGQWIIPEEAMHALTYQLDVAQVITHDPVSCRDTFYEFMPAHSDEDDEDTSMPSFQMRRGLSTSEIVRFLVPYN